MADEVAKADSTAKKKKAPKKRKFFTSVRLIGFLVLLVGMALQVLDPYPVQFLRVKIFDMYQQAKPRVVNSRPVMIIDLDENSLAEIGQWPWPRTIIADLVEKSMKMGAVLVAFDVVFPEHDRLSPSMIVENIPNLDPDTQELLKGLPSNDDTFAQVIKNSRVVLGQAGFWDKIDKVQPPAILKSIAIKGPKPHPFITPIPSIVRNVPELEKFAAGHGFFSLLPEPDGVVRRVPTLFNYGGDLYPALSMEMLRVAFNRRTILVTSNDVGVQEIGIAKGVKIQTDNRGRVWPYFSARDQKKYISARDILAGTVDPALIKGKMLIVGTSAVGLLDIRSTPVDKVLPGVEVHAQLIESVAENAFLTRPGYINGAELMLTLTVGLALIILVPVVGAKWTLALFLFSVGGAWGTSWYLFIEQRILLDVAFASIATLLLYVQLTYMGYAQEEAERRQVRNAFSHYMSPALVQRLAEDPSALKLGGERREMTLLFCDVRGFTSISELFDAEGLTKLINKFLTPLTNVILERSGTIDKYMGDCIMAFWNAPLDDAEHARHGCLSALEMINSLVAVNDRLEIEAKEENRKHIPLRIGIGLNTGECCVGNMGSDQRFDYSVLGDAVNLASRLEGQSKTYGVTIVIGESTYKYVTDLACIELDLIKVKGKTEAVRIFSVLGDDTMAQKPDFIAYRDLHTHALKVYRSTDWDQAKELFDQCRQSIAELGLEISGLYDLYDERMEEYRANPPGENWDGVFTATSK